MHSLRADRPGDVVLQLSFASLIVASCPPSLVGVIVPSACDVCALCQDTCGSLHDTSHDEVVCAKRGWTTMTHSHLFSVV